MRILRAVCLVGVLLTAASGANAVEKGQSGIGLFGSATIPLFKFSDWYSISPEVGINYNYVATPRIVAEIEYHYATMQGGDLDKRTFRWTIDQKDYQSPNASESMWFNTLSANALVHFKNLNAHGAAPYILGGLGFFGFSHEVSGLIFPGQTGSTLDTTLKLEPYKDRWAALTFSLGGGISIIRSERLTVDLRARYNMMLGELRPLEDWGLEKAFPLQAFDLSAGFKYFW